MQCNNIAPQDAAQVNMRDKPDAQTGCGTFDDIRAFLTDVFGGMGPEQVWTCAFANPRGTGPGAGA